MMGAYVLMLKEFEDDSTVVYRYGPNENLMGKIKLNKETEMISELEPIPDPSISSNFYFKRAAQKLASHAIKGAGNFPDKTSYSS